MSTTTATREAADQLAQTLCDEHELGGVEDVEEEMGRLTYFFETGHHLEVLVSGHGVSHVLHPPELD